MIEGGQRQRSKRLVPPRPSQACSGVRGENAPLERFLIPLTPFGGVHTSTGAPPSARFPGQWFQSESGLHQNWTRDYDPTTGRYLQADPLGLVDGASVYGSVGQSPIMPVDPGGEEVRWTAIRRAGSGPASLFPDRFVWHG